MPLSTILLKFWAEMVVEAYKQIQINRNEFFRIFSKEVLTEELVWHRDRANRYVTVVSGKGWLLQMEDSLPIELEEGYTYEIPAYAYHRIKRGTTDLKVHILESTDD